MEDIASILTALQGATPMMILGLITLLVGFVIYAGTKIINLLGNHMIHAIGDIKTELINLNIHESVETVELKAQSIALRDISNALNTDAIAKAAALAAAEVLKTASNTAKAKENGS